MEEEYKRFCDICVKDAIDIYYKNHLQSQTHINKSSKRQRLNNTDTNNSWS